MAFVKKLRISRIWMALRQKGAEADIPLSINHLKKNKISEMQVIQEKIRKEIMEKFITNTSDWYAKMLAAEQRCFTRKQNI